MAVASSTVTMTDTAEARTAVVVQEGQLQREGHGGHTSHVMGQEVGAVELAVVWSSGSPAESAIWNTVKPLCLCSGPMQQIFLHALLNLCSDAKL